MRAARIGKRQTFGDDRVDRATTEQFE
jgi:hypothetical protein